MSNALLAPTTEASVSGHVGHSLSCYVKLADTEKIIIELKIQEYDKSQGKYVEVQEKFQLEQLNYGSDYHSNQVRFDGGTIRGFRKDGGLRVRQSWIPTNQLHEAVKQIPDHYHDYARNFFKVEMEKLVKNVLETQSLGVKI